MSNDPPSTSDGPDLPSDAGLSGRSESAEKNELAEKNEPAEKNRPVGQDEPGGRVGSANASFVEAATIIRGRSELRGGDGSSAMPSPAARSGGDLAADAAAVSRPPQPGDRSPAAVAKVLVGHRLNHFYLEAMIGGGGMGAVFRAKDEQLDRTVAVKVVPFAGSDTELQRRFRNEAQSAAKLDHPHIAQVFDVGSDSTWHYIVFEYIQGINLRDLVTREGVLSIGDAVLYTMQLADALHHASDRGITHRDVKPSNVVLSSGRIKLVDMGLARSEKYDLSADMTASGVTLGTFDYISPEQARDPRVADIRSDLYSLGCTLFFMLCGRPPYAGGTMLQKLLAHGNEPPPDIRTLRSGVGDELTDVLMRLLAKDPDDRYQSPADLIDALQGVASRESLGRLNAGTSVVERPRWQTWVLSRDGQKSLPWIMGAILVVVIAIGLQIHSRMQHRDLVMPRGLMVPIQSMTTAGAGAGEPVFGEMGVGEQVAGGQGAGGQNAGQPGRGVEEFATDAASPTGPGASERQRGGVVFENESSAGPTLFQDSAGTPNGLDRGNTNNPNIVGLDESSINIDSTPSGFGAARQSGGFGATSITGSGSSDGPGEVRGRPPRGLGEFPAGGVLAENQTPDEVEGENADSLEIGVEQSVSARRGVATETDFSGGLDDRFSSTLDLRDSEKTAIRVTDSPRFDELETRTLAGAIAMAKRQGVNTIDLAIDNLVCEPIQIDGDDLTIRSIVGGTTLWFDDDGESSFSPAQRSAVIQSSAEQVEFQDVHIHWTATKRAALFRLEGTDLLNLTDCVITIDGRFDAARDSAASQRLLQRRRDALGPPDDDLLTGPGAFSSRGSRQTYNQRQEDSRISELDVPDVAPATHMIVIADGDRFAESLSFRGGKPLTYVDLNNVIVRGETSMVAVEGDQQLDLAWDNGLLAISGAMIRVGGAGRAGESQRRIELTLGQLVVDAKAGLVQMDLELDRPYPVELARSARKCVFVIRRSSPQFVIVGSSELTPPSSFLQLIGTRNAYDSDPTLTDPLIRASTADGVTQTVPIRDMLTGNNAWLREKEPRMSVRWAGGDRPSRDWHDREIDDYLIVDAATRGFEQRWLPPRSLYSVVPSGGE